MRWLSTHRNRSRGAAAAPPAAAPSSAASSSSRRSADYLHRISCNGNGLLVFLLKMLRRWTVWPDLCCLFLDEKDHVITVEVSQAYDVLAHPPVRRRWGKGPQLIRQLRQAFRPYAPT